VLGAFRSQVYWKNPDIFAREAAPQPVREKTRSVYLPAGNAWFDFWTGKTVAGGQKIVADAPIDKIPLMIKAGSIVPMGPFVQYSTEKPADPIELRIYRGADGSFTLYEDENDNYDYEKGVYATIGFHWNDAKGQLTVDPRKGRFPGMLAARTFRIVLVSENHGTGVEVTENADKVIPYDGRKRVVVLAN
jgi:alpha-D-xyloside xylohydrolase